MTMAKEMSAEQLAEVRAWATGVSWTDEPPVEDPLAALLDHVDALTADRDEARQEVAALREQRDEIREAHRVELAAVTSERERWIAASPHVTAMLMERNKEALRADAAEAKLAALVEAWDAWPGEFHGQRFLDMENAVETARGEP